MTNTITMKKTTNEELNMDELLYVVGGLNDDKGENDNAIIESIAIAVATKVIQMVIGSLLPDTFEEFYKGYLNHKTAVDATIYAIGSPVVIAFYAYVDKKKFWEKVYNALK